jgi:hypothetical protein
MSANHAMLPNRYPRPELVPLVRETAPLAKESDSQSALGAESLRRAKALMTAIDFEVSSIDFEVASALSLCAGWHAEQRGDIYMIRTLQRIAEHMKALQAVQASISQPREVSSPSDLHIVNRSA